MAEEKKERYPLSIKNLADLKRHIQVGTEFVATEHQYHPDNEYCNYEDEMATTAEYGMEL